MRTEKLIQVVAFILKRNNGSMDYYNLIKECYIADRRSIDSIGRPITGDTYVSMNRGPVLKGLYTFIKGSNESIADQNRWNESFSVSDHKISLISSDISNDFLSDFEENILENVSNQFYGYSYQEMKEYAHDSNRFPEWTPVEVGQELPLSLESIMKGVGISEKEIKLLVAEQKSYDQEATLFHTN